VHFSDDEFPWCHFSAAVGDTRAGYVCVATRYESYAGYIHFWLSGWQLAEEIKQPT